MNTHSLMHLPVLTESGSKLGKVYDINIDIDNHCIKSYLVRASFISQSYLIKPVQIVSISREQIIVEDSLIVEKLPEKKEKEKPSTFPAVALRNEK